MIRTTRNLSSVLLTAVMAASLFAGRAAADPVPTYAAYYDVEYKGRRLGVSSFSVELDENRDVYRFESQTRATGLAKLLRPKPAIERSEFVIHEGDIRPIRFDFEDGSRKGDDNMRIVFDWDAGLAAVTSQSSVDELPLEPGVLDRGALQVALMQDLAHGDEPGPYRLADADSLKTYRYSIDGRETLMTPAGSHETVRLTQRREGSSRETIVWAAPGLRYLPVRIEQRRDGETLTALILTSVEGL